MTESFVAVLSARQLGESFSNNTWVISRQVAGLTHDDSLIQPPVRGNCLNWVLGHIAVHRDHILSSLGEEKILGEEAGARYERGSQPIVADGEGVMPLEALRDAINRGQERIATALAKATEDDLAKMLSDGGTTSVAKHVRFLFWHESYHTGQTEILRQLAGTDDQVI